MRVLENHQDRPAPRQGFELAQQRLEQHLAFALRAEVQVGGGTRQRQQFGEQLDFVIAPRAGREQCLQLPELLLGRVVAREAGGAFELGDERIERAVLVMRRAEIAQPRVRLALRCAPTAPRSAATCRSPARPRPARPGPRRPSPAASAAAADRAPRRARRAASPRERSASKRLKTPLSPTTRQACCGSANPASACGPEILELEQPADLPPRASRR